MQQSYSTDYIFLKKSLGAKGAGTTLDSIASKTFGQIWGGRFSFL